MAPRSRKRAADREHALNEKFAREPIMKREPLRTRYDVRYWEGGQWVQPWALSDSYEEALVQVREDFPDAVIGHDGDLSDGGDRTFCWEDAAHAVGQQIDNACVVIYRRRA